MDNDEEMSTKPLRRKNNDQSEERRNSDNSVVLTNSQKDNISESPIKKYLKTRDK